MARLQVGTCLAGDCDEIADVAHVSTKFFHVAQLPLVPLGTVLVVGKAADDGTYTAIDLPFSIKSVSLAYVRAFLGVCWLASVIWGVMYIAFRDYHDPPRGISAAIMLGSWVVLGFFAWVSYRLGRGSSQRVSELQQILAASVPDPNADAKKLSARSW